MPLSTGPILIWSQVFMLWGICCIHSMIQKAETEHVKNATLCIGTGERLCRQWGQPGHWSSVVSLALKTFYAFALWLFLPLSLCKCPDPAEWHFSPFPQYNQKFSPNFHSCYPWCLKSQSPPIKSLSITIQVNFYLLYKYDLIPTSLLLYDIYHEAHALFQLVTIPYLAFCLYLYLFHGTL